MNKKVNKMIKVKMCERCGKNIAAVPDRNRIGRPINRICKSCHSLELLKDLDALLHLSGKDE
jgi:hypothetical protein